MTNPSQSVKHERAILLIIILLGLAMRLYGIDLSLVESHQIRQAQTAMMTRNLYEDHLDIFHTRLDFFGNVPGYIIMEFPLMHTITAWLYNVFGVHEFLGRLVNVVFSVGAIVLMYGLARQFLPVKGALAALVLYTFSPMNIFFSRAFMAESSMMFFMAGAVYFFLIWLDKQTLTLYVTATIFAALACLTKPTAGLIFAPIITAWSVRDGWRMLKRFDFWLYLFFTMMPIILWAVYAHYLNAIYASTYVIPGFGDKWIDIITKRGGIIEHWIDPKFYKFVGGSLIFLLLTPLGFMGTAWGICCAWQDRNKTLLVWLAAMIAYFYVLAGANSGHIYYHLPLLPVAAIFFGFSVEWLLSQQDIIKEKLKRKSILWLSRAVVLLMVISYGAGYVKYFRYMYSNRMPYVLEVSEIIKKQTPQNRFVIDNGGSEVLTSVLSYYCYGKSRWFPDRLRGEQAIAELEKLRTQGATTFVTMETDYNNHVPVTLKNKIFWDYLNEHYEALAVTDHYHIFDLRVPKIKG